MSALGTESQTHPGGAVSMRTDTQPDPEYPATRARRTDAHRAPVTYGCGGCDNRWPGVSRAHCSGCHRTFAGAELFDRHQRLRDENRTCLDPESITVTKKTGEKQRVMYLVNGIWSSVETRGETIGDRRRKSTQGGPALKAVAETLDARARRRR